jgi:hypothetical protein
MNAINQGWAREPSMPSVWPIANAFTLGQLELAEFMLRQTGCQPFLTVPGR